MEILLTTYFRIKILLSNILGQDRIKGIFKNINNFIGIKIIINKNINNFIGIKIIINELLTKA